MSYDPMPENMRKTVAKELRIVADEIERGDWDVHEFFSADKAFYRTGIAWGIEPAGYIELAAVMPVEEDTCR